MSERYDPWHEVAALGLRIVDRPLPGPLRAYWHSPSRTIVLDAGLSHRERRCSLAHEIVHVERGDDCAQSSKVETAVHQVAARRLLPLGLLVAAIPGAGTLQRLADELCVDEPTLELRLEGLSVVERDIVERTTRGLGTALRIA